MIDKIRVVIKIAEMDMKKIFKSPKIYLLFFFSFYFMQEFVNQFKSIGIEKHTLVTPYIYPLFMNDWMNGVYIFVLIIMLLSDAPFYDENTYMVTGRTSNNIVICGKILYMTLISFIFHIFNIVISIILLIPYLGFSSKWGSVIEYYASGIANSITIGGSQTDSNLISSYTPINAMVLCLILIILQSILIGMIIFLFNALFKNSIGIAIVSILPGIDLFTNFIQYTGDKNKVLSFLYISDFAKLGQYKAIIGELNIEVLIKIIGIVVVIVIFGVLINLLTKKNIIALSE